MVDQQRSRAAPRFSTPRLRRREWLWEVSPTTLRRFEQLRSQILDLPDDSPESLSLQDELRGLPGYPLDAEPWDLITLQRVAPLVTVGRGDN